MLTPDVSAPEIPGLFEGDPAGFDAEAQAQDTAAGEKVILRQLEACDAPEELSDCFLDAALFGECYVKRFVMEQADLPRAPAPPRR
jgi:hypothetical protein